MLQSILVPLDGSPLAETALEPATLLAKRFNAELLLVHTVSPDEPPKGAAAAALGQAAADPQAYLEAVARHLRSEGVEARISLLPTEPAEGIADEADVSQVDLILMATHGRRGLDALLHPSVTWEVLRLGNAPILTCKITGKDDPAASVKCLPRFMTDPQSPILVPLDGSLQSESVLPLAQALASAFGNPLLLVSAQEQPLSIYPAGAAWGPIGMGGDSLLVAQAAEAAEKQAKSYLEGKRSELASAGMRVLIEVGPGPAAGFIEDIARQHHAGLIVMASHGRGWLGRLVLGSVAQKVLRDVDMPVLLVRRLPPHDAEQPSDRPAATEQHNPS